jgi:MFS family permease
MKMPRKPLRRVEAGFGMSDAGTEPNKLTGRRLVPFLAGYALGNTGDMFTQVAVLWTGLSLSGRAISLAGLGGAWTLASAVMGLASGPIVDRFNRRNAIIWMHGCLALLSLGLFALAQTGHIRMWHLWAYLVGQSAFGVPLDFAVDSILPDLVSKGRLVRINGLLQSWGMTDNLVEAAVSGIVLAVWGPAPIFLFNGVMYLFGSAGALFVPEAAGVAGDETKPDCWRPLADLRITIRYIIRERLLRRYIPLRQADGLIFAPLFFMAPLVSSTLGWGSQGYGFFQSLTIGGVLTGSLLASSVGSGWPKVKMWIGGQMLYACGFLTLGIFLHVAHPTHPILPALAYGAFFVFGFGCTGGRVYQSSLYQEILPPEHRGRVFGIGGFVGGALQPLTLSLAMLLVDRSGVGIVLVGLAVILLALNVTKVLLLPLREQDWLLSRPHE